MSDPGEPSYANMIKLELQIATLTSERDEARKEVMAWKLAQSTSERAYMALVNQIPADRYDYDPVNIAILEGAKEQEAIGRQQIATLTQQLAHANKQRDLQKEVADNQTWWVQKLQADLTRLRVALRKIAHEDIDLMQARAIALTALTPAAGVGRP